eukprot:2468688-Rhodomonas_salina.1
MLDSDIEDAHWLRDLVRKLPTPKLEAVLPELQTLLTQRLGREGPLLVQRQTSVDLLRRLPTLVFHQTWPQEQ